MKAYVTMGQMEGPGGLGIGAGINHPSFYIHLIMCYCGCIIMRLHYIAMKTSFPPSVKGAKPNCILQKQLWIMRDLDAGRS